MHYTPMTRGSFQVGINGLFLDFPHTGTGVYTREVLSRLPATTDEPVGEEAMRYVVIGPPEHAAAFASHAPYVRLAPLRGLPRPRRGAGLVENVEKVLWEQVALPLVAQRLALDLLYAPYFSLPLLAGTRTVVTVHDLIPLVLPEYAPSAGLKAYFRLVSAATRRADAVVTDSRHSANDIARLLGVPVERLHVVYLGVDPRYGQPAAPERVRALRLRLGLPERFVLYLGGTDPRKNVSILLRALRIMRERGSLRGQTATLALVAPAGGRFPDPRDEAARLGVAQSVLFLDGIAEADKPALYAAATAFAYPSRYEGFGLPPLEAMAGGTPVLCANSSSLPEVVGDAAILLDPDDAPAWADAFTRIMEDDALRTHLAAQGRARAADFTWEETVVGLRRVFRHVLSGE